MVSLYTSHILLGLASDSQNRQKMTCNRNIATIEKCMYFVLDGPLEWPSIYLSMVLVQVNYTIIKEIKKIPFEDSTIYVVHSYLGQLFAPKHKVTIKKVL